MTSPENNNSLEQFISRLQFNDDGLIPVIAQAHDSREVLMMAWMNEEAIIETLKTGQVCYYSRSRQKLWRKGETSGQTQTLKSFRIDCDRDTILILVDQIGVACHTGRYSCFFEEVAKDGTTRVISTVLKSPDELYKK
ncbi:MAG: phosphoribosyl-AMP cyclohydrolase [Kordiimonadaceae bacterium]|nr:phosphoribosyl-AMP cyclohydrolase [Kordiimonadaceae bacterium]